MNVAFPIPAPFTHKLRFSTQFVDGSTTGQAHTGAQAAHLLVNDPSGDHRLRGLRYPAPVCRQRYRLEVTVGGTRIVAPSSPSRDKILYERPRRVPISPGDSSVPASIEPTIAALAPAAMLLWRDVAGEMDTAVSDKSELPVPSSASTASETAVICGTPTSHDTSRTDRAGPIPFTALQPASASARALRPVATLPPMICRSGYLARVSRIRCNTPLNDREKSRSSSTSTPAATTASTRFVARACADRRADT